MDAQAAQETESVAGNPERWRQKILAEMGLTYRALSAGPVEWRAFETSCRALEKYAWLARNGYPCPLLIDGTGSINSPLDKSRP